MTIEDYIEFLTCLQKKDIQKQSLRGNLETLGNTSREELLAFYEKHYSANRMGLALLSTPT